MARTLFVYISRSFENNYSHSTWTDDSSSTKNFSTHGFVGGASLVLNGELTLGQLIAFRIAGGYIHNL